MAYAIFILAISSTCLLYSDLVNASKNVKSGVTTDTADGETVVSSPATQDNPVFTFVDNLRGRLTIPEIEIVDRGHFKVELLLDFSTNQFQIEKITQLSEVTQAPKPISEPSVPVDVCKADMATKSGATHAYKLLDESVLPDFGKLIGNYSDIGIDTDGDGFYNSLKLSVGVQIHKPSSYNIVAWLKNASGTQMVWASAWGKLEVGSHTIDLLFDGLIIRDSGLNGPYNIDRVELRVGDDELLGDAIDNAYTTAVYQYSQFDAPMVSFTKNFSDIGIDTDGDGLYDLLQINVELDVQEAGTYTVMGSLDSSDSISGTVRQEVQLLTGSQSINLDFDGQQIFQDRKDGPYYLRRLRVEDAASNKIDFINEAYTTGAYTYIQFQHDDVSINADSYRDQGLDIDNDGDFDSLRVEFELNNAGQGGNYRASADLVDENGKTIGHKELSFTLTAGNAFTVTLDFLGSEIFQHGVNGPYQVSRVTLIDTESGVIDYQQNAHTTQAYSYTDF